MHIASQGHASKPAQSAQALLCIECVRVLSMTRCPSFLQVYQPLETRMQGQGPSKEGPVAAYCIDSITSEYEKHNEYFDLLELFMLMTNLWDSKCLHCLVFSLSFNYHRNSRMILYSKSETLSVK